jgi:hypothetical protein
MFNGGNKMIKEAICAVVLGTAVVSGCGSDVPLSQGNEIGLKVPATIYRGSAIAAADMNGDENIDILATEGNGEVFLYTNTGDGYSKSTKPLLRVPTTGYRGSAIAAADIDGDGDVDILATDGDGTISLYRNKGGNQF